MFPASTKGGGMCMTAGPLDVCKVPAPPAPFAPMPFPNMAQVASASGASSKVMIVNKPTVTEASEIPRSTGDEPGTLKGMVSITTMGKVQWKTWSAKVKAEGKGIVHLTSLTTQNGGNTIGAQTVPSQSKVILKP